MPSAHARRRGRRKRLARRDRALVSSYTSEAEIDLARNRSLQTINNVIQSSQAFSEQLNKRKVDVEAKKAESQGKPVVAVLDRELESIDAELARQAELIAQKKRETAAITAKYDADKQRWRELVAAKAIPKAANACNRRRRSRRPRRSRNRQEVSRAAAGHATGGPAPAPIHWPRRNVAIRVRTLGAPRPAIIAAPTTTGIAGNPWLNTFTR